jgi:hypothetical protein
VPSSHWTSHLRSRAGHIPYERAPPGVSTFTMTDNTENFSKFLIQWGYLRAASWGSSPVYHVKVVASKSDLLSEFFLDPLQVKKVSYFLYNLFSRRDEVASLLGNSFRDLQLNNEIGSRILNGTKQIWSTSRSLCIDIRLQHYI